MNIQRDVFDSRRCYVGSGPGKPRVKRGIVARKELSKFSTLCSKEDTQVNYVLMILHKF